MTVRMSNMTLVGRFMVIQTCKIRKLFDIVPKKLTFAP